VKQSTAEFSQGAAIDLKFDQRTYNKYFKEIDIEKILQRHPNLESKVSKISEAANGSETSAKDKAFKVV